MKKIILSIALVMTVVFSASAQDSFFRADDGFTSGSRTGESTISNTTPALPYGQVGKENDDKPAPIGSGLLVLTVLGTGYLAAKHRRR